MPINTTSADSLPNNSVTSNDSSRPLPSLSSLRAELAGRSFREFIEQSWKVVRPSEAFISAWHIDAIAEHLQAVYDRQIQYLVINIPPGHAKSVVVAVQFPAWLWLKDPSYQLICATYAHKLTVRDAVRSRDLITSPWYRETFNPDWSLKEDANEKDLFYNTRTGFRCSISVTGQGTGHRGNGVIYDDILSRDQSYSDAERTRACEWVRQTMSSRRNDLGRDWEIVIAQRLHEADPYGEMIASGKYTVLCLPSEYDPARRCVTSIGWKDPRTEPGELLFPALFPAHVIEQCKKDLGSYAYAGQHQQQPSPAEGGILKRHWWRYWQLSGQNLPPVQVRWPDGTIRDIAAITLPDDLEEFAQSWDCAFKDLDSSDYVVGQTWARKRADRFLLDQDRERKNFPATVQAVRNMSAKWPKASCKLIEDKANGTAVIASLRHEISGLIEVNPEGGKIARASGVSPQIESGNVYLPHPMIAAWVGAYIEECAAFPNAAHDDQVDATTQMLLRWTTKAYGLFEWYRQQAEAAKSPTLQSDQPLPPATLIESGEAQKRMLLTPLSSGGFTSNWIAPNSRRATKTAPQPVCTNCGNQFVSVFSESWKCNACGASGAIARAEVT
jgi:predicted phage terminase large subunit-like protein